MEVHNADAPARFFTPHLTATTNKWHAANLEPLYSYFYS